MNVKDLPWFDRPGERLTQKGVDSIIFLNLQEKTLLILFGYTCRLSPLIIDSFIQFILNFLNCSSVTIF